MRCALFFSVAGTAAACGLALSPHVVDDARGQATTTIDVGDFFFCSSGFENGVCETTVTTGDTVTWELVGASLHTVTECDDSFTICPPLTGGFNSDVLTSGASFSQTFDASGSFEYRCNLHPAQMRGRINVAAQATPTATAGPTTFATAGAGSPSASPGPSRTSALAAVPGTGGDPDSSGNAWLLVAALAFGVLLIASAGAGVAILRRR